jgi:hypothetical protein
LCCIVNFVAMQDQLRATKSWLQKQFKSNGVTIDPVSLEQLVQVVQDVPDPEEFVHSLIDEIEAGKRVGGPPLTGGGSCEGQHSARLHA